MAKISRIKQLLFGSSAGANQIGVFGSLAAGSAATTTSADTVQSLSNFLTGWFGASVGNNSPAEEDMNGLFFLAFYQLAYLMQSGIPEWNADTVYYTGSFANSSGVIYVSLTDSNTNNAVTDTSNWLPYSGVSVVAKTFTNTGYTAIPGQVIRWDATSGACSQVIPSASAGNSGQSITVKKTDTTFNAITLSGGISTTVSTQGESVKITSNGSAWNIMDRVIPSIETAYTPAISGFGTTTTPLFHWCRTGKYMHIRGSFTAGTVSGATATVDIPNSSAWSMASDADTGGGTYLVGTAAATASTTGIHVLGVSAGTALRFSNMNTSPWITALAGSSIAGTGQTVGFQAWIPIDQWAT